MKRILAGLLIGAMMVSSRSLSVFAAGRATELTGGAFYKLGRK